MMNWFRRQRLRYLLRRDRVPIQIWEQVVSSAPALTGLSLGELTRLRELATLFLHDKSFSPVRGLDLTEEMRVAIAAQACLLVLELGMDYFDGWTEIIVYPGAFRVSRETTDEIGLVHQEERALSGESWLRGPVVLSWSDIQRDMASPHPGRNVVIHEFAHKLDALNGAANGMPPLHATMARERWTQVLSTAYAKLTHQLSHHHRPCVNAYAATDPAEFFAVASEYFFTGPVVLLRECPEVYGQLKLFYRQDPAGRLNGVRHI